MQLVKLLSAFYYQSLFCFKTKEKISTENHILLQEVIFS